jgi:hypothetical protein
MVRFVSQASLIDDSLQLAKPALHVEEHTPALQLAAEAFAKLQDTSQRPQCVAVVARLTQLDSPGQVVSPASHTSVGAEPA